MDCLVYAVCPVTRCSGRPAYARVRRGADAVGRVAHHDGHLSICSVVVVHLAY